MKKIQIFFTNVSLGGLLVILPVIIIYKIGLWLFTVIVDTAQPLTKALMRILDIQHTPAIVLTLIIIFLVCFLLGLSLRTAAGHWFYTLFQRYVLNRIPGYKTINEIVSQFTTNRSRIFSKVALLGIGDQQHRLIGFVVDEYENNQYSVFVPTAPNPTSGFVIQTSGENMQFLNVPVEMAMKTIISCGLGAGKVISTAETGLNVSSGAEPPPARQ